MRRVVALVLIAAFVVSAVLSHADDGSGQDNTPERVSALETQVADLTGDVSSLRKRVKKLESTESESADAKTPGTFKGSGDASTTNAFGAGDYKVSAECSTTAINVYVTDEATGDTQIPISTSMVGEDGSNKLIVPKSTNLLIEVTCDGEWSVSFE